MSTTRPGLIDDAPSPQMRPALLSDRIRDALTDAIADGEYPPGAVLDEQQLAARFDASRTPVREALRQLAANGLVEAKAHRGVTVARLTAQRIAEMFETMAEIEATCARMATHRLEPLERSKLMQLTNALSKAAEQGDLAEYDRLNLNFHEILYRGTHNDFLVDLALGVRARLSAFRRLQLRQAGRLKCSRDEHAELMKAISEGDGELAARRMRAHMLNAAIALDQFIAAQNLR